MSLQTLNRLATAAFAFVLALGMQAEDGFVDLFNGRDLTGWSGKPGWWRVEDGAITAESTSEKPCVKHNYLVWRGGEPADFELRFEYRLVGGNSGVQFRSREIEDWDMRGYQADFKAGEQWTGALFEHERGGVAMRGEQASIDSDGTRCVTRFAEASDLQRHVRPNEWNEYRIVARGPEIQLFVNGHKTAHALDRHAAKAAAAGRIGLQMHPGPPMKVQFRKIKLKEFARGTGATPSERLSVPAGFKAELLYSPSKESEGSWVSMCMDPKGRLIVSGQYDEGLFRITPAREGNDASATRVEKIPLDISSAQGLCWAFDGLYALVSQNAKTRSGLYRLSDTDGDDVLDKVELLKSLEGGGDHGWHAVIAGPDGSSLYAVAGNNTIPPKLAASRVPPHWSEDHLLPRLPDAGGHMKGVLAPGGVIYRVSPDGQQWEMIANGFRNTYDAAFDHRGELFTYDADMEWDMGTPWYRPTRVCHVASGAEFGWRNGTGKWPAYQSDSLPGILDIGPGSPTGVVFGYGSKFPPRFSNALFIADWTFGRIYAVHLQPEGSTYRADSEVFVSGVPLPVTDMVINPHDGAMYFITGGWRIQTGLYRVSYEGHSQKELAIRTSDVLHDARKQLESFHGRRDEKALAIAWPYLAHTDRFLRYAARVALEWQEPGLWREKALTEKNPRAAFNALIALIRVSAKDEFHRKPSDPEPDPTLLNRVLASLAGFEWSALSTGERVDLLRAYTLAFTRLHAPSDSLRLELLARVEPWFPSQNRALNSELCQLLVRLQSTRVAGAALAAMNRAPTQEEQLDYVKSLRMLKVGWTPALRREYFDWFNRAESFRGGSSFAGFVKMIKADALAALSDRERVAIADVLDAKAPPSQADASNVVLAGRTASTEWSVASLAARIESNLHGRDYQRGRQMFGAAGCFQCHRFAEEGGATGPDLTRVAGRFSARDLLEAILEPSKAVSDLYGNMVVSLADGESVTGRIVYLHGDAINVNTDMFNPANTLRIDRKAIRSIEPSKTSPMPEGLLAQLTEPEIFDLLAYLLSGGDSSHSMFAR